MAWIRVIPPEEAEGKLVDYYARVRDASGSVDNILTIHSLRPESLRTHYELYRDLMYGPSELTRAQREMVAVVVSATNHCHYWIIHHAEGLRRLTKNEALIETLSNDYTRAPISDAERAMLDYSVKLTREPWNMKAEDVERLRAAGLSDAAILDLNLVASYYAFVNRIADGLGVTLESRWGR